MKRSDALRQQIEEAKAKQEALNGELDQINQNFDELAGLPEVDPTAIAKLQTRRAAILSETEIAARRVAVLSEQREEAVKQEAVQRLGEIERENAGLVGQAEGLMSQIAEACTVIQQALSDLKPLLREREVREHEREFLSLTHSIHSSALSRLPVPDHNFLASLEKARGGLWISGTDEWERKTQDLKEKREQARHAAAKEEGRKPGIRTIGQGKHWSTVLRERDEEKGRELSRQIVRGPQHIIDAQRR